MKSLLENKSVASIRQTRIIYILTTVFLVALSLYTFNQIKTLIDSSNWVNQTNEVKLSLEKISTAVLDAETNQKSFLLIGDSSSLVKRDSAFYTLRVELNLLDGLTKNNPEQYKNLEILQAAINEKLLSMKKVLRTYSPSQTSPEFKLNVAEGIQKTKNIKQVINKMSKNETHLLTQRTKKYLHLSFITPLFIIILFIGALLILLLSYLKTNNALHFAQELQKSVIDKTIQLEKNKELNTIFQKAPVTIVVYRGNDFKVEVINEIALQMWGKKYEEAIDKPFFEISPELKETMHPLLTNILETGEPFIGKEYPAQYIRNGKLYSGFFDFTYQPLEDTNGNITAIVAVGTEITSSVHARNRIEESEERLRFATETTNSGTFDYNIKTGELYWSPEMKILCGFTKDETITREKAGSIIHPDDAEHLLKASAASRLPASDGELEIEHRIIRPNDKQIRWVYVRSKVSFQQTNGQKEAVRVGGILIDITDRKKAEVELKESREELQQLAHSLEEKVKERTIELKESEQKFYNLFNLSPVCKTLSETATGKIIMVNDAFVRTFGYSREETINKTSSELGMLEAETREKIVAELRAKGKILNKEIEFTKKTGERFVALTSAELINIADRPYFLGAYNDITERKNAEQIIKNKNLELEKMNKELQSFTYISSHDLQEPLRKIQTFATRIIEKEQDKLSENAKHQFERMQNAAKRMQALIGDLLAYSRTNTEERIFEKTDLNKIIEEVKEDLEEELKEKQATIELTELCDADIIPFQFRQLMHNLIGNSLKFSIPGNPPHIKIKSQIVRGKEFNNEKLLSENKYCHITVTDNGIGFEPQYSQKIFEVFQRLHGKNEYQGTGIGLAIVKKIVENHNGTITAQSESGKGATFDIYIPAT